MVDHDISQEQLPSTLSKTTGDDNEALMQFDGRVDQSGKARTRQTPQRSRISDIAYDLNDVSFSDTES